MNLQKEMLNHVHQLKDIKDLEHIKQLLNQKQMDQTQEKQFIEPIENPSHTQNMLSNDKGRTSISFKNESLNPSKSQTSSGREPSAYASFNSKGPAMSPDEGGQPR